ncbi:MAG: hypothetical protein ACR2OC_03965 [Solirubrobacterales bacterium]
MIDDSAATSGQDDDNIEASPEREASGAPRWVKVSGFIALGLGVLVVALMLFGGGDHGPGRHTSSGDAPSPVATSPVEGHTPPAGGHAP